MVDFDRNTINMEIPLLKNDKIDPVYIDDFPFPVREAMDELASSLLSTGGGKVFVNGLGGVGKSYIIQQFVNNIGIYLEKTTLEDLVFLEINPLHMKQIEVFPGGFLNFLNAIKNTLSVTDEEICVVTESPEIASLINLENKNIKLIVELSTETLNELLKGESMGKSKFWTSWDNIDVDKILLTKKELIDMMDLSFLPNNENIKFERKEISLFISYILRNSEIVNDEGKILIPIGLWCFAFRKVIGTLKFSSDKKLKNKQNDIVYSNVMKKVSVEVIRIFENFIKYSNSVNNTNPSDKIIDQLKNMGVFAFSAEDYEMNEKVISKTTENTIKFKDFPNLKKRLSKNIIGQEEAIDTLVNSLVVSAAGINDKNKPLASFLFTGKSGVGKTSLALNLAKELAEEEMNVVRLDMSEYGSRHEASKLFGSPSGYVGYEEGGVLTNAIKANPNSIILLDEVEKADSRIWDSFLQIFDAGRMTDNTGEIVSFTNTIIIMTSNLGVKELSRKNIGFGGISDIEQINKNNSNFINKAIKEYFKPEFINRIDQIVFFNELSENDIKLIIKNEIGKVNDRLKENNIELNTVKQPIIDKIFELSETSNYGAREVQRVISKNIVSQIAMKIIEKGNNNLSLKLDKNKNIIVNS